jgi:hypothetical protein
MIAKIVHTAKHTVKAAVLRASARVRSGDAAVDWSVMTRSMDVAWPQATTKRDLRYSTVTRTN